jgi:hypothetical protein
MLQVGLAASSLPIAARAGFGATAGSDVLTPMPLYKVIYDDRFAASRLFAARLTRLGIPTHGIRGDVTDLWYHDLYARWRTGPAAIAGLTAHGAFFCLDLLARDAGMRVLFQGEHEHLPDGRISHAFTGPAPLLQTIAAQTADRDHWSHAIAELITSVPEPRLPRRHMTIISPAVAAIDPPVGTLYSWVIAPKAAA